MQSVRCMYLYNIKGRKKLKQREISVFSKFHKENNKHNKTVLHFWFFTCCAHPFSYRTSLFKKRPYASWTYFHYVSESKGNEILESVVEYIRQKLKKHVHLKISSRDEVLTRLFSFFHRGINFYLCLFDRDEFIPGKFISAKRCKQEETFRHRQGSSWDEISRANTF